MPNLLLGAKIGGFLVPKTRGFSIPKIEGLAVPKTVKKSKFKPKSDENDVKIRNFVHSNVEFQPL